MNGIEEVGERILAVRWEHEAFTVDHEQLMEETRDLVFRYCRWFEYQPRPVPKTVTDHLAEGVDYLAGTWY